KNKGINIFQIDENEYKEYFDSLKNQLKLTSFKRKYSSIKNFYKYLWKNKLIEKMFEYHFSMTEKEYFNKKIEKESTLESLKDINYNEFINSLEDNLYGKRIKLISILIAELNMNLANIFEIQIKDLLSYDFKKIIINRNNKIFDYDLNGNIEAILRDYYKKYAFEKRFLFGTYNIQAFRKDLKKYNFSLANLKTALNEDEESMYKNIKKIYFEIGIGDK
ncbi:MAG: transposase, partial [Fusobacterium sp.]|uniref:transposase n=1 Tax=Fusobacterium sp. TaxID=68766 RepID=UPI0026DBD08E